MNDANEEIVHQLLNESSALLSNHLKLLYRDAEFIVLGHSSAILVWYASGSAELLSDASPRRGGAINSHDLLPGKELNHLSSHFGDCPVAVPWREARCKSSVREYASILLFPSGLRCGSEIKAFSVLRRERLGIATLLSNGSVVTFVSCGSDEPVSIGSKCFVVHFMATVGELTSPSTISFVTRTSSESVFVTDSVSERVKEFRFERSVLVGPRTCSNPSIISWYLQSGLGVNRSSRLTIQADASATVASIIGISSNGDSQGNVEMSHSPETHLDSEPDLSIFKSNHILICNSRKHFRVMSDRDFDFPCFVRRPFRSVWCTNWLGRAIVLISMGMSLGVFTADDEGVHPIPQADVIQGVDNFAAAYDGVKNLIHVCIQRGSEIEVLAFHLLTNKWSFMERISSDFEKVLELAVRAPVSERDELRYALLSSEGLVQSSLPQLGTQSIVFKSISFSSEYFLAITSTGELFIQSLIPCMRGTFKIALPSVPSSVSLQTMNWRGTLVILLGRNIVIRSFDRLVGISWRLVDTGLTDQSISLSDSEMFSLNHETGQISVHAIPDPLLRIPSSTKYCILNECLSLTVPNSADWYTLPSDIRSYIESIINTENRSCDCFGKKFLISYEFSKLQVPLTSDDLAWAGMSDSQCFVIGKLLQAQSSWEQFRETGIGFWCCESPLLKEMVEKVQKSCLQDYMRSKDPEILDAQIAVWLAALSKQQLLASLYKQHGTSCASPGHSRIAQFFASDLSSPENANKGTKNAFELVRQKRYGLAVAVFIFSGAIQEAVDVCCRQMKDVQLALVILRLLRLRIGSDTSRIDEIMDQVWRDRIEGVSIESGDVWFSLLYSWHNKDIEHAINIRDKFFDQAPYPTSRNIFGPFSVKAFHVCFPSVVDFIKLFADWCKRHNRPVPSVASEGSRAEVSEHDRLYSLYTTGCSQLALTSPKFHEIDPILKWAIHEGIMLPRSDTSTS